MKVRLISPADIELNEAVNFYNHQSSGLGFRFFQEIDEAIERISFMPDLILVTAVAHMHRDPEYFKARVRQ